MPDLLHTWPVLQYQKLIAPQMPDGVCKVRESPVRLLKLMTKLPTLVHAQPDLLLVMETPNTPIIEQPI